MIEMEELQKIERNIIAAKAKRDVLQKLIYRTKDSIVHLEKRKRNIDKARYVIQEVAIQTQKNIEFHIKKIVTIALSSVLPSPPEFIVRFETKRNQPECFLLFKMEDVEYKPTESSAGGELDIASFALKVVYWSLKKNRPTFILDEPFKFLSPNFQSNASEMIKTLSDKLGIQFIIVSHQQDAIDFADNVIEIGQ